MQSVCELPVWVAIGISFARDLLCFQRKKMKKGNENDVVFGVERSFFNSVLEVLTCF
jgi:hypothetical protein